MRKQCGWGLIYELSKKKGTDDEFLLGCIDRVGKEIDDEPTWVRVAMGGALVGIGKRNPELNRAAVGVAKQVGPIDFSEEGGRKCDPFDPLKHLTSEYVQKKFAG